MQTNQFKQMEITICILLNTRNTNVHHRYVNKQIIYNEKAILAAKLFCMNNTVMEKSCVLEEYCMPSSSST